jgi:hypothetical protein
MSGPTPESVPNKRMKPASKKAGFALFKGGLGFYLWFQSLTGGKRFSWLQGLIPLPAEDDDDHQVNHIAPVVHHHASGFCLTRRNFARQTGIDEFGQNLMRGKGENQDSSPERKTVPVRGRLQLQEGGGVYIAGQKNVKVDQKMQKRMLMHHFPEAGGV